MRRIVPLVVLGALVAASASSAAPSQTRLRLVPNAVAFADRLHGVLGTGYRNVTGYRGGAIETTADGGRTWHVAVLTPRPVIALTRVGPDYVAQYDDGETLRSRSGQRWNPVPVSLAGVATDLSDCPRGMFAAANAGDSSWALCTTQPGAGNQGKVVYRNLARGWVSVACTGFAGGPYPCGKQGSYGGISSYGYPLGIAGNSDGFGLIWESRGTLYSTSDGGRHWHPHPKVARPEIDFGSWAFVLPHGDVGWVVLQYGGTRARRLLETMDGGRTWRIVHRWR